MKPLCPPCIARGVTHCASCDAADQDFHSLPQWRADFDTAHDGLPAWVWMIVAVATVGALAGLGITVWGWIIKAVDAANVGVAPW